MAVWVTEAIWEISGDSNPKGAIALLGTCSLLLISGEIHSPALMHLTVFFAMLEIAGASLAE